MELQNLDEKCVKLQQIKKGIKENFETYMLEVFDIQEMVMSEKGAIDEKE